MAGTKLEVRKLAGALGAEVRGVNLADYSREQLAAVREAFLEHLVVVLPDQDLTPAQQIAFTAEFGPVEPHPLGTRASREGHPEVLVLENKPGKSGARNDWWHSDISFGEIPPAVSVLYALEATESYGDTMFSNMYASYDQLSDGMKRLLGPLSAMHDSSKLRDRGNEPGSDARPIDDIPPPVEHPVVRRHPESGRLALYVNPYFTSHIAGMTREESQPLLQYLHALSTRSENVFRHRWRSGDVLMWDNRCAMHYAIYDYTDRQPRLMNRTTAGGDRPLRG